MKNFTIKGYHYNTIFILYLLFIAPLLKDAIVSGKTNYWFGVLGILTYFLEAKFLFIKTLFVLKRFEINHQNVISSKGRSIEKPKSGYFIWYMTIMRFLFRIGVFVVSLHLLGVADYLAERDIGWLGGLGLCVFILFELIILMYFNSIIGDVQTKEEEELQQEKINEKFEKLNNNRFWFMKTEWVADLIMFIYSALLFTGFWDILQSEMISDVEGFYDNGESLVFSLIAVLSGYLILCFIALIPMRLPYWIEDTLRVYTIKDKWQLRVSFLLVALSFARPVLQRIFELYSI